MGFAEALARHSVRFFGPPPPKGAPEIESWKFVRRIYSRLLIVIVPVWILVLLDGEPTWLWIVFGFSAATWLHGFISVNLRIRKLRGAPPDT